LWGSDSVPIIGSEAVTDSDPTKAQPARTLDLGTRAFHEVLALQRDLVAARQADTIPDTLVLVEHPEVITLGRSAKLDNVLAPGAIPVVSIERGGDVTYHGPGQLLAYPIFRLRDGERDLHQYLRGLEEAVLRTLADFDLAGMRIPGRTGVWIGEPASARKLASIGVAVRRWVTMHGLALNVNTDLGRFAAIKPCGFAAGVMTSMARELGRPLDMVAVKQALAGHLAHVLRRQKVDSRRRMGQDAPRGVRE
jgi:lipoyl(octanoyl) transferase